VTITGTMPGSPAEKAGLKAGDQVTAIDGQDMSSTPPDVAVTRILGPAGTSVHLTILRQGSAKPLEVDVTRAKIDVPSVVSKMLTQDGQRIAYIQLTTFGESTAADLTSALHNLLPQKPAGIVLDLRNNGGGYLTSAVDVVSQFVDQGTVLIEQSGDGTRQTYNVNPGGLATQMPLVVLVNGGTASAAEITAGAMQDHGRGQLVGTTTYGKGSVQNWIPLTDNAGAVRITVAHWLTPNGHLIQGKGLTPDVVVPMSDQDTANGKDPQLDKAVQILLQKVTATVTPTP
jgi:carboxyl-terminal processing protease